MVRFYTWKAGFVECQYWWTEVVTLALTREPWSPGEVDELRIVRRTSYSVPKALQYTIFWDLKAIKINANTLAVESLSTVD